MLFLCGAQNKGSSTDGNNGTIIYQDTVFIAQKLVVQESTGKTLCIAKGVKQLPMLVSANIDDAMQAIHTTVGRLDRYLYGRTRLSATDDVVALFQRKHLFEAKHIFNDGDASKRFLKSLFVQLLFLAWCFHFCFAQSDTELFFTIRTNKHKRLAFGVLGFVEGYVVFAFRTADSFHCFCV